MVFFAEPLKSEPFTMKSVSFRRNISLGLVVWLVLASHCTVEAKEEKKAAPKETTIPTTATSTTKVAKQTAPTTATATINQTTGRPAAATGGKPTQAPVASTKKPEKKELAKKKSARSIASGGPEARVDKLKQPKDLTTAEGHEKKYMIVKKKPKKKKPKKIKMKIYEPKIKYKKVKVKVPVKKYKKKKVKGYLVKKKHHYY